ncbi:MAG TPA: hypothetical protein DCR96_14890 [Hyphomonas sp.]|nr:hypothetical protein [Hyphomonas sp.]HBJ42402.1 hypothetical protein [Hyphomonas sp.]
MKELTMMKSLKYVAAAGALGAATALATSPAYAQLGIGVGVDTDVDVGVGVRTADPHPRHRHETYVYDGYESGHWHTRHEIRREHRWNARYKGYDCYESFQYTWEDGERVRYDTTFCYNDNGRKYEPDGVRATVKVR